MKVQTSVTIGSITSFWISLLLVVILCLPETRLWKLPHTFHSVSNQINWVYTKVAQKKPVVWDYDASETANPGIGQAADIRDLSAAFNAGRTEGWNIKTSIGVAIAGLAFVSLLGDVAKSAVKPLLGKPASAFANAVSTGKINYGSLDSLGRPTGVTATIATNMIGTGSPALRSIIPPGFQGGAAGQARAHLLGNQLGGSGSEIRNLVTLQQNPVNSPIMRGFENQIRAAVEGGQVFQGSFVPVYLGNNLIPRGITIIGQGSGDFKIGVSILNPGRL